MIDRLNVITNSADIFHIYVYVPAGSIYEDESNSGCSHLLEHMMFKNRGDGSLVKGLTEIGARYNATTYNDVTYYYIHTHSGNYRRAIELMGYIVNGFRFTDHDLQTERNVVIEEYNQASDSDGGSFFRLANKSILDDDNVYGKSVIGSLKVLKNITAGELKAYARERYKDIAVVVNCDRRVKKGVERELRRTFGKQRSFDASDNELLASANRIDPKLVFVSRGLSQVVTRLSFLTFPASQIKDHVILKFIQYCLTGSSIYSLLNYQLREKRGMVYGIHSYSEVFRYAGFYYIQLGTSSNRTEYIISMILHTLSMLKKKGMSKKALRYYRNSYLSTIRERALDQVYRTEQVGLSLFYDVKIDEKGVEKIIKGISNDDIIAVSRKAFSLEKMGVFSVGDYSSVDTISNKVWDVIETYQVLERA